MSTAPELPPASLAEAIPALIPTPHLRPLASPTDAPVDGTADLLSLDEALGLVAPRLRRYAARRLGDIHEAEEVVQEALLRACQHQPGFATEDDLMAWATVVTGRLVIDRLRLRTRSVSMAEIPDHARTGRDTADVVVARDEARAALDALEAMPARQAAVLWAREVEGLSYDDIASRFTLSEPTVRSLLHRARRTLRREYAARGGTLPVAGVLVTLAPWHSGLRSLDKLRRVASQALGPITTGVTALAVIGATAVFVAPSGSDNARPTPTVVINPVQTASTAASPTGSAHRAPTSTARSTPAAATGATAPSHALGSAVLPPQWCVANGGSRTGTQTGVNCATPDPAVPVLVVAVPRVRTPDGKTVGVSSSAVDCRKLPNTPVSRCAPGTAPNPVRTP